MFIISALCNFLMLSWKMPSIEAQQIANEQIQNANNKKKEMEVNNPNFKSHHESFDYSVINKSTW